MPSSTASPTPPRVAAGLLRRRRCGPAARPPLLAARLHQRLHLLQPVLHVLDRPAAKRSFCCSVGGLCGAWRSSSRPARRARSRCRRRRASRARISSRAASAPAGAAARSGSRSRRLQQQAQHHRQHQRQDDVRRRNTACRTPQHRQHHQGHVRLPACVCAIWCCAWALRGSCRAHRIVGGDRRSSRAQRGPGAAVPWAFPIARRSIAGRQPARSARPAPGRSRRGGFPPPMRPFSASTICRLIDRPRPECWPNCSPCGPLGIEAVEDVFELGVRDAGAVVLDADLDHAAGLARAQRDASARRREAARIADQVAQHLHQPALDRLHHQRCPPAASSARRARRPVARRVVDLGQRRSGSAPRRPARSRRATARRRYARRR